MDTGKGEGYNKRFVYLITICAALGGFLFGYDTAVISGAIGFLETKFELSAGMKGWAASSAIIGCIIGAMVAGKLSDVFGRKKILILTALLFGISAIGSAIPQSLTFFVVARILGGIGVGAASILSPLYITEVAPAKVRGRLVSIYQLAIVLGILIIFFVNLLIQNLGDDLWNIDYGWRYMFGSEIIPSIIFLISIFFVPESPRWLTKEGRDDEAIAVLDKINSEKSSEYIHNDIKDALAAEKGTFRELIVGKYRPAIVVGIVLSILSQFQGINAIMYYAPEIFKEIGENADSAFLQTLIIGIINTIFTFVAISMIDKWGRRILLLYGGIGMFISLVAVGFAFFFEWKGMGVLIFILTYIACFAFSYGPVTWVIIAEIFPTKMRGIAISVSTFSLWAAVYLVTQLFPVMLENTGPAITFWIFAGMSLLALGFTYLNVPETKEKTLEEIERSW